MLKRQTLGFKMLGSLALILTLVIGANIFIFTMQRNDLLMTTFSELTLMNNAGKIILVDAINRIKQRTIDFSSDGFIRDATEEIIKTGDVQIVAALGEHLKKNKMVLDKSIYGINIVNEMGIVVASTDSIEVGKYAGNYLGELQPEDITYGAAQVSDFMFLNNFNTSVAALTIITPLTDKKLSMRTGSLVVFIKAESIIDELKEGTALFEGLDARYNQMEVFIADRNGRVVDELYLNEAHLPRYIGASTVLDCATIEMYNNRYDVPVLGAALCMDNGWKVITETPQAQSLKLIADLMRMSALLISILITLILVFMYVAKRKIIDPIKILSNAAQKIGEGNFEAHVGVITRDEIGNLGEAFNSMTEKLRDSHSMLSKRIREVTRNLEKFKLAVEGASDHVIITDKDGVIIYANKAAAETTGYTQEEMIGNRPSLWGKQMPNEFYRQMWHMIKEEKRSFLGEVTNKRKNGQLYVAEAHIAPMFDEQKQLYGFVGVERDITHQKEIDRAKTEFVSIASHQLRTPLTIINWYVEMLSDPKGLALSEKQKQYTDEILRASNRMIDLVNSLLNVSRIDMGTFGIDVELVDFAAVSDDVLSELALQCSHKKLTIVKQYDKSLPAIKADIKLLRMIFQNILTNAAKYTPEGGVISIGLAQRSNNVLITVSDNGFGIPAHQREQIFTKFFRADNAREKEPDGNGLGLYIVKSIVERAGGRIWFTSEENKGTAFYVELPLVGMQPKEGTKSLAI